MKILFIGTSHGMPEKDRFCSSAVVTVGDANYIIDAGVSLFAMLQRHGVPYESVRAVFTTHTHGDHTSGLVEFVDLLSWRYKDFNPAIYLTTREIADAMTVLVRSMDHGREVPLLMVSEGVVYEDENVRVSAVRTAHTDSSYAYILEAEGKRVVFTGDMKGDLHDYPAVITTQGCDLVVCESAHNHLDESLDILLKSKTPRMIVNHVNPKHSIDEFNRAKPHIPFEFILASDGDEYTV